MNSEVERELNVVMGEEKAKVVLGPNEYKTLPYVEWVDGLKAFVTTQRCPDCLARYDLDDPEEEIWGWFKEDGDEKLDELEVVEFICEECFIATEEELEETHPRSMGTLLFRRPVTGTFPYSDEDEESDEAGEYDDEDAPNEDED